MKAASEGLSARNAEEGFGVSAATAIRWVSRARDGELYARRRGRRRRSRLDAHEDFIISMIEERKEITLNEMVACLAKEPGLQILRSALNTWLRACGFTFKKDRTWWDQDQPDLMRSGLKASLSMILKGSFYRRNRPEYEDGTFVRAACEAKDVTQASHMVNGKQRRLPVRSASQA